MKNYFELYVASYNEDNLPDCSISFAIATEENCIDHEDIAEILADNNVFELGCTEDFSITRIAPLSEEEVEDDYDGEYFDIDREAWFAI